MLPGISFVVPAHDRAPLLLQTLSSLFAQKNVSVEVIVVDDGSQPPLRTLIEKNFPETIVVRLATNQGPAAARNAGVAKTTHDFVCFFDSDDIAQPDFAEKMIAECKKHNAPVVCLSHTLIDNSISPIKKIFLRTINEVRALFLTFHAVVFGKLPKSLFFAVSTSRVVFPESLCVKYRFNEDWRQCEEWELLLRIMKNHQVHILPQRLIQFRFTPNSQTVSQHHTSGTQKYRELLSRLSWLEQLHPTVILFRLYTWWL